MTTVQLCDYFYVSVLYEEFDYYTKGIIRIRTSKKNRQHNGQKKKTQKDKQRFTKHTYKTKDRVNVYRDLYI